VVRVTWRHFDETPDDLETLYARGLTCARGA